MHAVFLDRKTFDSNISIEAIEQQVTTLTCYPLTSNEQVIERCLEANIVITNKVVITAEMMAKLPNLTLICVAATGTNNVDLTAANDLGIAVTNVSGYAKHSVAQYVFAQILEYFSQTCHHHQNVEQGKWQNHHSFCFHGNASIELASKTLGIIGYGSLGKSVEKIATAFDMNVLIAERPHATNIRAGRLSFEKVIAQADVISLHCPQTPETENLINKQTLELMKPTAILINTARGAIVNSKDLLQALTHKQIAYAVLDVLEQEPPPADHPLLINQPNNLKITAHIAWASIEAQQRLINLIADNIAAFKQGARLNRVES